MLRILAMLPFIAVSLVFFAFPVAAAEEADELKMEIKELREKIEALESRTRKGEAEIEADGLLIKEIEEKIEQFISVGGYMDMEYIASDKPNFVDGFRVHHFSLLLKKQVSERWSVFSELEFEDGVKFEGDTREGKILVEAMYGDVDITDYLTFRFGRYLTPAGIWIVDHYPPFVPTQERPQHIRQIFPQYVDGIQFFGGRGIENFYYKYSLYAGNGFGEAGSGDSNSTKDVGGRFALKVPYLTDLEVGVSGYTGRDSNLTERDAYGGDVKLRLSDLKIQAEYATAGLKDGSTGAKYDRNGWYTQFCYDIGNSTLVYRYDWYERDSRGSETTVNTFAYNYHFTPKVVGKLEYHLFEEPTIDYYKAIGSIAIYFGD